mmetsp:Transcript_88124/g.221823  ORF Transcript_88124/g.221823 Transcript_88124/m.221823 type:complete len:208 (-) Transcript_88124:174-797(-)
MTRRRCTASPNNVQSHPPNRSTHSTVKSRVCTRLAQCSAAASPLRATVEKMLAPWRARAPSLGPNRQAPPRIPRCKGCRPRRSRRTTPPTRRRSPSRRETAAAAPGRRSPPRCGRSARPSRRRLTGRAGDSALPPTTERHLDVRLQTCSRCGRLIAPAIALLQSTLGMYRSWSSKRHLCPSAKHRILLARPATQGDPQRWCQRQRRT